jgi:hypothetical protein
MSYFIIHFFLSKITISRGGGDERGKKADVCHLIHKKKKKMWFEATFFFLELFLYLRCT